MEPIMPPPPVPWYTHPRYNLVKRQPTPSSSASNSSRAPRSPSPIRKLINAVYYPSWQIYKQRPPSSLQLSLISHIFYAFLHLTPDGEITLADEYADTQIPVDSTTGLLNSLTALKSAHPHLKIILSIGGGGTGSKNFRAVASDSSCVERLAKTARAAVDEYQLDGIDIDWEHPNTPSDGINYIQLLTALRRALPRPKYLLTTALPAGEWALKYIPLPAAAEQLDFLNLMAYDFAGPWTRVSGHHAQLYSPRGRPEEVSGDNATRYLLARGVDAEKILLGIPAYGRSFLGCRDVGEKYGGSGGDEGTFEFRDLPREGATEHCDMAVGAAYCCGGDGGFVSYDNTQTTRMKAAYVREKGMGGVFFWTGTADREDRESLVEASFKALHAG